MSGNEKLRQFITRMLSDLGSAASVAMVRVDDEYGPHFHSTEALTPVRSVTDSSPEERDIYEQLSQLEVTDRGFFRDSARECRQLARTAPSEQVKWELLLWAREFDAIAHDCEPLALQHKEPERVI